MPHKERLANLHAICLQIPLFVSSDEKFDDASIAQSLCGIAIRIKQPDSFSKRNCRAVCVQDQSSSGAVCFRLRLRLSDSTGSTSSNMA